MVIDALIDREFVEIGAKVATLAFISGGIECVTTTGTASLVGGCWAVAGSITLLVAGVLAAYQYYSELDDSIPVFVDGDFLPPLTEESVVSGPVPAVCVGNEKPFVSKVFNTEGIMPIVTRFLSVKDTTSVEQTCVAWSSRYIDHSVWKLKCDQEGIPPIRRKQADPRTGRDVILSFYKEAYVRLYPMIFGPKQYSDHLRVKPAGEIRRMKDSIHADIVRLDPSYIKPLPFWRALFHKAERTYRLIYLSKEIERTTQDGALEVVPMTMNELGQLALGAPKATQYRYITSAVLDSREDERLDDSDWVLISAEVLPGSRHDSYVNHENRVSDLGARLPKAIEVIALSFFEHCRFGTYLFGRTPLTYSRTATTITLNNASHRVLVGSFSSLGLCVDDDRDGSLCVGVAAALSCGS